jgi:hypothetical protein
MGVEQKDREGGGDSRGLAGGRAEKGEELPRVFTEYAVAQLAFSGGILLCA